jgi:hypothetical protein
MIPFDDEQSRRPEEKGPFVFRLYVVDEGPTSARAIANLSAICKNQRRTSLRLHHDLLGPRSINLFVIRASSVP